MRTELDERQTQETEKIGTQSFYVMYMVCAAAIVLQIIFTGKIQNVLGETIVLISGGLTCITGSIRRGIHSARPVSVRQLLAESLGFSSVFTVFYGAALIKKTGGSTGIAAAVLLFFIGITFLCFAALKLTDSLTRRRQKQQEQKYSDEE